MGAAFVPFIEDALDNFVGQYKQTSSNKFLKILQRILQTIFSIFIFVSVLIGVYAVVSGTLANNG
jgi:hypothetical protein